VKYLYIFVFLAVISTLTTCKSDKKSITMNIDSTGNVLLEPLMEYISGLKNEIEEIPSERLTELNGLADYISSQHTKGETVKLLFVCTHNSRRSHMSQLWAQAAATYFDIPSACYSGGTEATAFNPRAVKAMQSAGFTIEPRDSSGNPVYLVYYAEGKEPVWAFSKRFDDGSNPDRGFAAVMTCSEADEACPIVPGAEERFSIPYIDPKVSDDTDEEEATYNLRCRQIAAEMVYVFSQAGNPNE
jgi:protein-tyrosine-phosphatase